MTDLTTRLRADGHDEAADEIERLRENKGLTSDAMKFNAPRHWGQSIEASVELPETDAEIEPVGQPNLRRVRARRPGPKGDGG